MIRSATLNDVPGIVSIVVHKSRSVHKAEPDRDAVSKMVRNSILHGVAIVSIYESTVVGAILGVAQYSVFTNSMVLTELFWGGGHGPFLYRRFIEAGKDAECTHVYTTALVPHDPRLDEFISTCGGVHTENVYVTKLGD